MSTDASDQLFFGECIGPQCEHNYGHFKPTRTFFICVMFLMFFTLLKFYSQHFYVVE